MELETQLNSQSKKSIWNSACSKGIKATDYPEQCVWRGKVRDIIDYGTTLRLYHSDRLSAFDKHIGYVPNKGILLNAINSYWFDLLNQTVPIVPYKKLSARVMEVKKLIPIKMEVIVRNYLAGSLLRMQNANPWQLDLSKIKPYAKFPHPVITPTSKADKDLPLHSSELIKLGVVTPKQFEKIQEIALKTYEVGEKVYAQHGWILADTKYEFGIDEKGTIHLMDEIHTPDSSRLWRKESYAARRRSGLKPELFDKDLVRNYLIANNLVDHIKPDTAPQNLLTQLHLNYKQIAWDLLPPEDQPEIFDIMNLN